MSKFKIRIIKKNGDIDIYTNPYKIEVNDDAVGVDYEDKSVFHDSNNVDKIIIEPNH